MASDAGSYMPRLGATLVDRRLANGEWTGAFMQPQTARRPQTQLAAKPKVVVFDLDGCLWEPEMYELWGGGAPFSDNGDGTLADRSDVTVRLLGAV